MKSASIFKKVINVTDRRIVINIPEELINKEVEITIRPFKKETKKTRLLKIFKES